MFVWNDNSTYFIGRKVFEKGDIFPRGIVSESVFKNFLASGKLIYVEPPRIERIKLSISVMAHPSREYYFAKLKQQLGDAPFAIDQNNNLIENCKAAWRLHDKTADFHVVIQDDAIVCNNFKERAENFITDMESKRIAENQTVYGYNFFIKPEYKPNQMLSFARQGYIIEARNRGGVAICLPVNQIESMLKYFDTLKDRHDDERISQWVVKNKFRMCFPIPSLIDHDDDQPSLAGNKPHQGRHAYKFIDSQKLIIPKIIHQLWISDNPAPEKWMQTWRDKNPGWLYRLWTDKDLKTEKWINQKWVDYYYQRKIWHGVKDVCQYEILYNHGGCFFDADTECLLPINELFTDEYDSYSYWENEKTRPGYIQPIIAAVKVSKFAKELIDGITDKNEIGGDPFKVTGNKYVGEMYKKTNQKIKIFPSYYFNPIHFSGMKYTGNGKVYAQHYFGSTLKGIYEDKKEKVVEIFCGMAKIIKE